MATTFLDHKASATTKAKMILATPARKSRRITVALTFLIGCVALSMTGFAIIMPVFPQRLQALGLGAETLALMEGAFGLGMFLLSTPMGTLAGRIGRKPILLISLAGFIVTNLLLAFVNVPLLFILIRFVEGMVISGLMPASLAIVGDTIPTAKQGRWIGFLTTAQATGIALGPGIGGFLYQAWGFTSPFLLSASIALLASLLCILLVPETLPAQAREEAKAHQETKTRERGLIGLIWLFAPFLFIDFGLIFIYPFVFPQYPFFFEKVLHYSTAQYGLIISVYGLALAVFPLFLGRLSEQLPKKPLIIAGSVLFGALNVFMFVAPLYPLLLVGAALAGLGSAFAEPALGSIYLAATTDSNRGQVMGIRGSAISLAVMLGPLVQALIGPWTGPHMTFAIGIVLSGVIVLMAMLLLKGSQEK
ncbi:tetracycline resistance MFS efflux pump [Reticulibacter mediterranei]|uniref:Tetracycline resistance MFS efflux pump n=1 Tax=Reticulibacter mediterranei TaxID=2778369 RepID=A0A8J3IR44_9CHLR|nr:MFS transporter [Reticulibacter mediterranei]GHO99221.1 tetracycline resistance MFS efflux pump [Reticulibacter mediterranei]